MWGRALDGVVLTGFASGVPGHSLPVWGVQPYFLDDAAGVGCVQHDGMPFVISARVEADVVDVIGSLVAEADHVSWCEAGACDGGDLRAVDEFVGAAGVHEWLAEFLEG